MNGKTDIDGLFWKIALHDDEDAFHTLFTRFFTPLCVYALRYVSGKEVAEDIIQDTFLKIWKNRKTMIINTSGRNFLVTNVKNACIDYLRKRETEQYYLQKSEENAKHLSEEAEELYSIVELESMLSAALAHLPENIRKVFEMNRFEGKTYAAIATEQNLSVKTIEAYMSKALKLLRNELKDYLSFAVLFLW
jgi:RNA polymerase sigma-70 factor (ECF subfamily)